MNDIELCDLCTVADCDVCGEWTHDEECPEGLRFCTYVTYACTECCECGGHN